MSQQQPSQVSFLSLCTCISVVTLLPLYVSVDKFLCSRTGIRLISAVKNLSFLVTRKEGYSATQPSQEFSSAEIFAIGVLSMVTSISVSNYASAGGCSFIFSLLMAIVTTASTLSALCYVVIPVIRSVRLCVKETDDCIKTACGLIKKAREEVVICSSEKDAATLIKQESEWFTSEYQWEALEYHIEKAVNAGGDAWKHISVCPTLCNVLQPPTTVNLERLEGMGYYALYNHCRRTGGAMCLLYSSKPFKKSVLSPEYDSRAYYEMCRYLDNHRKDMPLGRAGSTVKPGETCDIVK